MGMAVSCVQLTFGNANWPVSLRVRTVRRWVVNVAIALLGTSALTIFSILLGASWTESWMTDPVTFFVVTTYLAFMYWVFVPAIVSLGLIELLARTAPRHMRAFAIAVALLAGLGYLFALFWVMNSWPSRDAGPLFSLVAVAAAAYGSIVRLPATPPRDIGAR